MSGSIRRILYWLGGGVSFLLFLFFLIPEPKDNPYMKIYSASNGNDFSGCEFSNGKGAGVVFRFQMAPEDCRLVDYSGGEVLTISVEYPSMKLVRSQVGGSIITFRMFRVSVPPYDTTAIFEGRSPVRTLNGMRVYQFGGFDTFRFTGDDGVEVAVSSSDRNFIAKRLMGDLRVSYQYESADDDLKKMDVFALNFLRRIIFEVGKD